MNIKERIDMLRSLKKEFAEKQALLAWAKRLREEGGITSLSKLLESDLEQAKLILAAKDVCDRLQKIAEHLAELGAEEIMPLADAMKGAFGPDAAATFEHAANSNIQTALETVRAAKDSINDAILQVEGKMPPQTDMSQDGDDVAPPNDMAVAGGDAGVPAADTVQQPGNDTFAGADAAAGPENEPLGRARKESRIYRPGMKEGKSFRYDADDDKDPRTLRKTAKDKRDKKKDDQVEESVLTEAGQKILKQVSIDKLMNWLLFEAAKTMPRDRLVQFSQNVITRSVKTPESLAGWIGKKRWGATAIRKLVESTKTDSRAEAIARGIATVIETNISLFGKGKAAQVVESYTNDLMEGENNEVLEAFGQVFKCSPAMYSLKLAAKMREDDDNSQPPMSPQDKQEVSGAVSQLASKMAGNPSLAGQPAVSVIAGLDPNAQTALQKIAGDRSTGNIQNVGQLVQAANDKMKKVPGSIAGSSDVTEAKRANKGENVEDNKKGVGKPKKLSGTNIKNTIAKEAVKPVAAKTFATRTYEDQISSVSKKKTQIVAA